MVERGIIMAKRKKADWNLRKFRKSNTWITLVFFVIAAILACVFVSLFVSAFLSYVVDNKMTSEYNTIQQMAIIYENAEEQGYPESKSIIDTKERDFFIKDKDGNIIFQKGENTCSDISGTLSLTDFSRGVKIYLDTESNGFILEKDGKDGDLEIDPAELFKWMLKKNESYTQLTQDNSSKMLALPFWFCIEVKGGQELLFGKAYFQADLRDGIFMAIFAVAIGLQIFTIFVLMLVNIISAATSQRKMTHIFFLDPVTRDHNWMYFLVRGEHLLRHGKSRKSNYAVLDLVFVKYRNYCVCHSVEEGEKLLRNVNAIVNKQLNKKEICSHYASANFALLKQYKTEEELKQWIENLLTTLQGMDPNHHFAFHIGVELLPVSVDANGKIQRRKNVDLEKEYNNACAARTTLEESDDSGYAFLNEQLIEEQKWIDVVHEEQQKALENEEFVVYYQPKYDPRTKVLKGAEALLRWDSPRHGFKSPGAVIPIFEKNGFIVNIDHYMITHVARDQKKWLDAGYKCVPISVNISRAHFIEPDLAEQIRDMVDAVGTPHELLELEVTESAFFDDKKALVTTIQRLQSYGFMVSMDDFGSGYSSLNSLKDMPLNILKLDAGFFSGDLENERGEIVVSEAIRLAKSLHMETVAEGVELKEQVDFLARQGCDMIQGYYFARPMPPEDYETRMCTGVASEVEEPVEEIAQEKTATSAAPVAEESISDEFTQTEEQPAQAVGETNAPD